MGTWHNGVYGAILATKCEWQLIRIEILAQGGSDSELGVVGFGSWDRM